MRRKIFSPKYILAFTLLLCTISYSQQDTENSLYKNHKKELKEDFKTEKLWYRIWNRYDINPGFSKYALGYSFSQPLFNWDQVVDKGSIRYRKNHLDVGVSFWKGIKNGEFSTTDAFRISAGYITPISALSIGKRHLDVMGFLIQPSLAMGFSVIGKERELNAYGLYISPSIHIQLPFVIAEIRGNFEYALGSGLNVYPELSFQLDALRTLLDPHKAKTGIFESYGGYVSPLGGGWYKVTSTYTKTDFTINDIGPIWGVTPRIGFAPASTNSKPFKTYGIGISGRINFIGADIHYNKGYLRTGIVSNSTSVDPTVKSKFDNEKVKGLIPVSQFNFEANISVVGILLSLFKKQAIRDMGFKVTPLNRFNFNLGLSYILPGTPQFEDEAGAIKYTDEFFAAHPDIERDLVNDPLQFSKGWGVTYGWSYEMGAIGLKMNNVLGSNIGKSSTFEVYYILPITKIIKVYNAKETELKKPR